MLPWKKTPTFDLSLHLTPWFTAMATFPWAAAHSRAASSKNVACRSQFTWLVLTYRPARLFDMSSTHVNEDSRTVLVAVVVTVVVGLVSWHSWYMPFAESKTRLFITSAVSFLVTKKPSTVARTRATAPLL